MHLFTFSSQGSSCSSPTYLLISISAFFSGKIPSHVAARLPRKYCMGTKFSSFHHYPPTSTLICHYLLLFVTVRDYSSLFATIRHYSRLYSRLFATIRTIRYSRLFAVRCSLFATIRCSLFGTIRCSLFAIREYSLFAIRVFQTPPGVGVGAPLYELFSHVQPQRLWFFSRFDYK